MSLRNTISIRRRGSGFAKFDEDKLGVHVPASSQKAFDEARVTVERINDPIRPTLFSFSKKSLYRVTTEHFSAAGLRRFVVVRSSSDFKELYGRLQRLAEFKRQLPKVPTSASVARKKTPDGIVVSRRKSTSDLRVDGSGSDKVVALEQWLREVIGVAWDVHAVRTFLNRVDDDDVLRAEAMAEVRRRDRAASSASGAGSASTTP